MAMFFMGLGNLLYISVLMVNAIAILSEDRFLARVGWSAANFDAGFGQQGPDNTSIKTKIINLIASVRTLMRIPLIFINVVIVAYAFTLG